jgi:hypothetical protein
MKEIPLDIACLFFQYLDCEFASVLQVSSLFNRASKLSAAWKYRNRTVILRGLYNTPLKSELLTCYYQSPHLPTLYANLSLWEDISDDVATESETDLTDSLFQSNQAMLGLSPDHIRFYTGFALFKQLTSLSLVMPHCTLLYLYSV